MVDCYFCGEPIQEKDTVVALDMGDVNPQDHGGVLLSNQRSELAHPHCLGSDSALEQSRRG